MRTIPLSDLLSLIGLIKVHFRQSTTANPEVADEIHRVLDLLQQIPPLESAFSRSRHPAARHLKSAFAAGNSATDDLIAAIRPVASYLPWRYSYPKRTDAPGLGRQIAFAEIIGPEAPFRSETVCLGLTLIGPETLYPAHTHPAIELYYVVAGTAEWTADGVSQRNPPGAFILHPSQAIHSMKTDADPLLAVYSWSGEDVKTTSAYTPSAA